MKNIEKKLMLIVISFKHHNFIIFLLFNLAVITILPLPPSLLTELSTLGNLTAVL